MLRNVPEEISLTIFSLLPPHFLLNSISTCCKHWHDTIKESDFLWMNYFVDYYGEEVRREWKSLISEEKNWFSLFKELSRRLSFRKLLIRGNVVELKRDQDLGSYQFISSPLMKQNTYCLSDIPVHYKEGGYGGYHLFHPTNNFENLSYDIDLYISVNITSSNLDLVLRGEMDLESSGIAKKMGGITVRQESVEHIDLYGKTCWSIRLEPLLRFSREKKNYLTRLVNCTNIYHYPKKNYVVLGINSSGIKVLNCSDGSLVWENEDGPNKKIHLNDAVNNSFGIIDSFCSDFKTFHAWNVENGDHLWSINLFSLLKNIKNVPGVKIQMRLMDVVSGNFLLQPMDDDADPCYLLVHSLTGRLLAYFYTEVVLQMVILSVEEQDINDQQIMTITNVCMYTLDRVCLLEFRNIHRKSDNVLISMDRIDKWSRYLECGSYSEICGTSYLWLPLDGRTIRKRRFERGDYTPLDELGDQYLFDLLFIHKVSMKKFYLERVRLDDGNHVYMETLNLHPLSEVAPNRAGTGPMNLNRESISIFGEVRGKGELFLIIQTANIDTLFVIDLESGSTKSALDRHY